MWHREMYLIVTKKMRMKFLFGLGGFVKCKDVVLKGHVLFLRMGKHVHL